MKLILGSSSKWRQEVLRQAGFAFEAISPGIDEKAIREADPEKMVLAIANAKADAIVTRVSEPALVITADQVVVCDGKIREKPRDEAEAREFIASYAQHPMETVNGIVITNTASGKRVQAINSNRVYYRSSVAEIADYLIAKGEIFTCSGGFQCEDPEALKHMERLEGTFEGVKGMPVAVVRRLLQEAES